ncbi:glutamyl-tRNA amidotransferase subunit C [Acetobacter nitrogenifigens DSM 23921 = NBRC 105050]|uniref:Aspartyl/glutamyl-tRNA(Asn/Gln) amidotransferase subunit C n=2 Tax=Acetobacter TaxID=434 RepID=A0A511X5U0_9PROT|nr:MULTISPECIES: Asp-tRNA(Asn)/Glu-tRNA(Gln) amidotransferase subunit GatC [Acetobacter]MBO1359435.1 Asp-tRNA(Asn)/Glu-tRNA(Gln) amidotransferase subunit GatC [Acetobacter sacchari]GBQ98518.1 glutamyl-tRNA amidotransferase subunit C [Acetobacter nitrogenifigens DSM 23921 = NBRC 105050]GEN58306.1 glutamyl-tRNA(Gln) amidotransferase subunit C [Acetobacter nitrogenifigens DSM 23921 = NBRC 105050]
MSLDLATTRRIAKLARIGLDDQEIETVRAQMGGILGWIEILNEVDVEGVPPMVGTSQTTALPQRQDAVTDGDRQNDVLANAPDREGPFFTVPKVVE